MITRIVKMTFEEDKVQDFLALFEIVQHKIRNFNGCVHLELWRDINHSNIFFTYSKWESDKNLQEYRNSALFADTWANTKVLFAEKAEAWSVAQHTFL